jgi:hypothetical protein
MMMMMMMTVMMIGKFPPAKLSRSSKSLTNNLQCRPRSNRDTRPRDSKLT